MDTVIKIKSLSKRFRIYDKPIDRLKEWLTPRGMSYHWAFWALKDINLEVKHGASLGIIGANGAGKSTLLKILCGTLSPTAGSLDISGRITGLLELGSGFHPEFTGRQNIFLNASLLGLNDDEIQAQLPKIIEFAELGEFIDHPLRIYSTGMALRLGFSVAANINPDILIIDEALAVGDAYFQQKCLRRLREFKEQGGTLLFVSHDPGAVRLLCDEAVLLHEGRIAEQGNPDDVLNYYNALVARQVSDKASFKIERARKNKKQPAAQRSGTFDALLTKIDVVCDNKPTRTVVSGSKGSILVELVALSEIQSPTVGIALRDRLGYEIFATNTFRLKQKMPRLKPGDKITVKFSLNFDIGPGNYTVTAAVHSGLDHLQECYDWADKFIAFKVLPETDSYCGGVARLAVKTDVKIDKSENIANGELLETIFGEAPSGINLNDDSSTWMFSGWHPPEETNEGLGIWTHLTAVFVMRVGEKSVVKIDATTDIGQCADNPLSIELFANGKSVGRKEITTPQFQTLTFEIPNEFAGQVVRFSIQCGKSFIPAELYGTNDKRELGIMVKKIFSE
ncbi:Wzt carbohydrate-binding domain-containing protein [bacterium]|nr:Wzt carbohydrate-binding domain-containing protein [bacterium]